MSIADRIANALGFVRSPDYGNPSVSLFGMGARGSASSPRPNYGSADKYLGRFADEPWVFSCIRIIQTKAASVELKVYSVVNGKKVEQPNHPLKALLDSVNPFMDANGLQESTHGFKEGAGNALWFLDAIDGHGLPTEIYPLPPSQVKPIRSRTQGIIGYEFSVDGSKKEKLDLSEVLHFKNWNPFDQFWGLPTISAGRDAADMLKAADEYNVAFFKNSAESGGFLSTDKTMSPEQVKVVKESWAKNHQGSRKAHKVEVLFGGMTWNPNTTSHHDMMFPDLKRMSREEVLTCFNIPPVMVGVFDEANYSNADVQERIFWKSCILPRMRAIESVINERLAPLYGDVIVAHDTKQVAELQEDAKTKAERDKIYIDARIKTVNEVRAEMDLPPVDWGYEPPQSAPVIDPNQPDNNQPPEKTNPKAKNKTDNTEDRASKVDRGALRREAIWQSFRGFTEHHEIGWIRTLLPLFNDQEREVKANLRKAFEGRSMNDVRLARTDTTDGGRIKFDQIVRNNIDVILYDRGRAMRSFRRVGSKLIETTLVDKARQEEDSYDLGAQFNVTNPRVTAWIETKAFNFAESVNETTLGLLRDQLKEGIDSGETINEIAKRIESIFDDARASRSRMIARTEVISASNEGAHSAYEASGVVEGEEWISSRDEKVRDSHRIDGEVAPLSGEFSNGLKYPGDPDGEAEDVINCRCTIGPVVKRNKE